MKSQIFGICFSVFSFFGWPLKKESVRHVQNSYRFVAIHIWATASFNPDIVTMKCWLVHDKIPIMAYCYSPSIGSIILCIQKKITRFLVTPNIDQLTFVFHLGMAQWLLLRMIKSVFFFRYFGESKSSIHIRLVYLCGILVYCQWVFASC